MTKNEKLTDDKISHNDRLEINQMQKLLGGDYVTTEIKEHDVTVTVEDDETP